MDYIIKRIERDFKLEDQWQQGQWAKNGPLQISNYMGSKPEHFPLTQTKLLYDDTAIYVFFRVLDRYVRAVAQNYHGSVWQDSCVEFFFTGCNDADHGYFNLEMNCGGTFLFHHQTSRNQNQKHIEIEDCKKIRVLSSMPGIIETEIVEPVEWTVKYSLPVEILQKYAAVETPAPGVIWKANFYKCADLSSHPHWLTWNHVDMPEPDFHCPQYFGNIIFE